MRDGTTKDLTDGNTGSYYTSAVFSPDGQYVAASHHDGRLRLWHVCTGQLIRRVKAHKDIAFDVKFTPDGKGLVSGGGDKTLKYWDISSWDTIIRERQMTDQNQFVSALEEETLPDRQYSGHMVRSFHSHLGLLPQLTASHPSLARRPLCFHLA